MMQIDDKAIVIFSGGQDSTVCLGWAKNRFKEIEAITFDYGQRHEIELIQAKKITNILGIKHTVFKLSELVQLGNSALIGNKGEISAKHTINSSLPASYVPNRNALFFTISHAYAQKIKCKHLVTGICQSDYSGYPDCRIEFAKAIELALNLGSESDIKFHYPLMYLTKAQTFELAFKEGVLELVLKYSHTCYEGVRDKLHDFGYGCGKCPACKLRKNGYKEFIKLQNSA